MTEKVLTGRKVFVIFFAAFAVIIGVNITLAVKAISTFPGLETKNSYVASQHFNADRAAQLALGWTVDGSYQDQTVRLQVTDKDGNPVRVEMLEATLGRATHVKDDMVPVFEFDGKAYVAEADLAPGNWNLRMVATAKDGTLFRQRVVLYVPQNR